MIVEKDLTEKTILSGINKIYGTLSGGTIIQFNDNTYLEMDTVTNTIGIPRECMGAWGEHALFKLVRFMNLRDLFHSFYVPYVKMRIFTMLKQMPTSSISLVKKIMMLNSTWSFIRYLKAEMLIFVQHYRYRN